MTTRRQWLRGTFGAAIALPAFASLAPRAARAAAPVKRFLAYVQPLGTFPEMFWPVAPGATPYSFPTLPKAIYRTGTTPLATTVFDLGPSLQALMPHRDDLLVVEGIDNAESNHPGFAGVLTGCKTGKITGAENPAEYGNGPSIDQVLGPAIGKDARFPTLGLAVQAKHGDPALAVCTWLGSNRQALPMTDPAQVFDRLFADLATKPGAPGHLREQRQSILDAALGQAESLRRRLGTDDRQKLDQYLQSVRSVETRIAAAPAAAACQRPATRPAAAPTANPMIEAIIPDLARQHFDLLALAFACDLTRVATFQPACEANNYKQPWLNIQHGWHDLSHTGPANPNDPASVDAMVSHLRDLLSAVKWNVELVAYAVARFKELNCFEGTTVLYTSSMSNGQIHTSDNIPVVLLSGPGGFLRRGAYVRLGTQTKRWVNDLHLTLLEGFGAPAATFGDADKCKGPLAVLRA